MNLYTDAGRKDRTALSSLLCHRISESEKVKRDQVYLRLGQTIQRNVHGEMQKALMNEVRYCAELDRIGYSTIYGYYYIASGDRGNISEYTIDKDENDFINTILSDLVHSVTMNAVFNAQDEHRKKFRYYTEYSSSKSENGKYETELKENKDYIYNCEYDQRVPWFELHLRVLSQLCDQKYINQDIIRLEKYLESNSKLDDNKHWRFNIDTKEFEIKEV